MACAAVTVAPAAAGTWASGGVPSRATSPVQHLRSSGCWEPSLLVGWANLKCCWPRYERPCVWGACVRMQGAPTPVCVERNPAGARCVCLSIPAIIHRLMCVGVCVVGGASCHRLVKCARDSQYVGWHLMCLHSCCRTLRPDACATAAGRQLPLSCASSKFDLAPRSVTGVGAPIACTAGAEIQ